jgi:hypothetical protein
MGRAAAGRAPLRPLLCRIAARSKPLTGLSRAAAAHAARCSSSIARPPPRAAPACTLGRLPVCVRGTTPLCLPCVSDAPTLTVAMPQASPRRTPFCRIRARGCLPCTGPAAQRSRQTPKPLLAPAAHGAAGPPWAQRGRPQPSVPHHLDPAGLDWGMAARAILSTGPCWSLPWVCCCCRWVCPLRPHTTPLSGALACNERDATRQTRGEGRGAGGRRGSPLPSCIAGAGGWTGGAVQGRETRHTMPPPPHPRNKPGNHTHRHPLAPSSRSPTPSQPHKGAGGRVHLPPPPPESRVHPAPPQETAQY